MPYSVPPQIKLGQYPLLVILNERQGEGIKTAPRGEKVIIQWASLPYPSHTLRLLTGTTQSNLPVEKSASGILLFAVPKAKEWGGCSG